VELATSTINKKIPCPFGLHIFPTELFVAAKLNAHNEKPENQTIMGMLKAKIGAIT